MSQAKDVEQRDEDVPVEDAPQAKQVWKADYRGAAPRDVAAALLAYRPKPRRSGKGRKRK